MILLISAQVIISPFLCLMLYICAFSVFVVKIAEQFILLFIFLKIFLHIFINFTIFTFSKLLISDLSFSILSSLFLRLICIF